MVQFKKLRLSGFKSFVEATDLDIGEGLTGIVGPNGCGKSNLVEALRWAMGENSPKRMRSSGMDDVIFSGTDGRPARNTAEVVISLDNADRTAPAELNDSDELEVSRKIERQVGSVYKVNGKSVRMRDVQLLFADSSIGAHSPAMVSQGRVADMINAKPTQRRMVLEEAAGISGLHARRHEAELKLRAAETNLTRLEDVLGSMNTQLDSLKKQARQASRYRNLSGHIQNAEGSLLYLKWQDSQTAVAAALVAFEDAETIVRDKTLEATQLTTQQTEAATVLPALRQSEAEAAAALQRLKLAYGGLESEERQVQEEREKSENLMQQFTADIAHENVQKNEAAETLRRLTEERETLTTDAQQQIEKVEEARILRDEAQTTVARQEAEISSLTEEVARLDAQRTAADRHIQDIENRLTVQQSRKTSLEAEHTNLISATPAKAEMDEILTAITQAEQTYTDTSTAFDQAEAERVAADEAQSSATEALQSVEKTFAELTAEAEALRRILRNQQEGYEPVIDKLNVETGLEKALAVALGDDLQAALDGAAPIFWRELPAYDAHIALPGRAKPLTQFVQGPPALARVLSQIGVVDTADEAINLMTQLQPGQCLVTLEGGAWRWDGLVVSADAENASAIRLQQKNRLAELDIEIATIETRLNDTRQTAEQARTRRSAAIESVNRTRQAFRAAEENLTGLRRRQSTLSDQLTDVTARLSSLTTSIETAVQEIDALTVLQGEARDTLMALPDTSESRENLSLLKEALTTAREALGNHQAAFSEIQRASEARDRRIEHIGLELDTWNSRQERISTRLIELEERITQAQEVLARLANRPAEIEQEKQGLLSHITEAEEKRRAAADALATAENTANDLQRDLRAVEATLADARESRAMAQAGVNTTEHTQSSIEATILGKFSATPEEMAAKLELKTEELKDIDSWQAKLDRLLRERDNMGPVNLRAEVESQEITDQMSTMETERDDLMQAIDKLREGINKLNKEARERLLNAFDTVNAHFQKLFTRLFQGGSAHLKLIEADDPLESGLEIYAQPPGKKLTVLSLLSGGEQTLTSIALIFGMFLTNPAPICVLDEVDAPLDESNVDRFCTLLEDLTRESKTRFIIITHHRMTMARMDRLYGVTMSEKGVSQLVSVDLKQQELDLEAA